MHGDFRQKFPGQFGHFGIVAVHGSDLAGIEGVIRHQAVITDDDIGFQVVCLFEDAMARFSQLQFLLSENGCMRVSKKSIREQALNIP